MPSLAERVLPAPSVTSPAAPESRCSECDSEMRYVCKQSLGDLAIITGFPHSHEAGWNHDMLVHEGQTEPLFLVLTSGIAVRRRSLSGGKSQLLSVLLSGNIVGQDLMLVGEASCSVEAVTDVTFCRVDPRSWPELVRTPAFLQAMCKNLVHEQMELENRLAVVGGCKADGAVAHFLVSLYDRLWARQLCFEGSFRLPFTNRQFAEAVGITAVHLHRVLTRLTSSGILAQQGRRILVFDLPKLRSAAISPHFSKNSSPAI